MMHIFLVLQALFFTFPSFATAESPIVQGLGGAGRGGIAKEALFANPASGALLTQSYASAHYVKSSIPEFNAGGRMTALSIYDGTSPTLKGGLGYFRTSRARLQNGRQGYEDRSEYRFVTGLPVVNNVLAGLKARYITKRTLGTERSFFQGDLGALFPLYESIRGGLTYENVLNEEDELPPTLGAGAQFGVGYGIQLVGDGYRLMKGTKQGERGWAVGAEASLSGGFQVRGGRFQEAYRRIRGWSLGGSWVGPRLSIDYAMRTAGSGPKERDHILGMNIVF